MSDKLICQIKFNLLHLKILEQGVETWNKWRKANPHVKPDLSNANLRDANLRGSNLSNVDFRGANLIGANLRDTSLTSADLSNASLNGASLIHSMLNGANISHAELRSAVFEGAVLREANLNGADLWHADFTLANLGDANFSNANLRGAVFSSADLTNANLSNADLCQVQALRSNLEGITLTGACIEDWNINADTKLNSIICDYVYLKWWQGKEFRERRPYTGTFAPGEFSKLFQQSFDTIDLIFRERLDWKAFAYSFKQVEVLHENAHLEVRSIENKGDGVVIVKVAAAPDANKALIHSDFTQLYEVVSKTLAAQYEARLLDKDTQLREQSTYINRLLGLVNSSQEVQKLMAEQRSGDHYYGDIKAVNFTPHGNATGGVYNDFSNTQDLAQAAAQIQALLAQLQQQGHSPEDAQQQVANDLAEQADQDPALLGKLVKWGQKLGDATVTDVVKGVVKMALRAAGVPLP